MGIYDVPAAMLIEEVSNDLKTRVKKPTFTDFVKTGAHRERTPINKDWFYVRMASVLYRVYKEGNVGTGRLRTYYGGRKKRGVRPEKKIKASGKILRVCLQMLEKDGLIKKDKFGRKISPKGEKFLNDKSRIVQKVFDEMRSSKKAKLTEQTVQRVAAREKAKQEAAKKAEMPQKGQIVQKPKVEVKPAAPQVAVQKSTPSAGEGDGRGNPQAKKV